MDDFECFVQFSGIVQIYEADLAEIVTEDFSDVGPLWSFVDERGILLLVYLIIVSFPGSLRSAFIIHRIQF